jgi:hypothetical protein
MRQKLDRAREEKDRTRAGGEFVLSLRAESLLLLRLVLGSARHDRAADELATVLGRERGNAPR